jgi:hypothetical protein
MDDYETDTTITPEPYKDFHAFVNEDPEALEKQQWHDEEMAKFEQFKNEELYSNE